MPNKHRICTFLAVLLGWSAQLGAQAMPAVSEPTGSEPEKQVHWATAAFFGTGWYTVSDNRSMFIFRIPPRQTLRQSGWTEAGERQLGIEIQYPVALGLHQLDDLPDFIAFDNYGTITFTPGVEVEIPVNERWYLRPFGHIGFGYERQSEEWAGIWYGGLKSRYLLGSSAERRWSFLSSLYYAGYKPEYKNRGRYGGLMSGFEFDHRMRKLQINDEPLYLNWHLTYNYLFDDLQFHINDNTVETINDTWELGVALGRGDQKLKIWFMSFEHIGLSFKASSNGAYKAVSLNFRSPFTD